MKQLLNFFLFVFLSISGIAQFQQPIPGLIYDNAEQVPKVGWDADFKTSYAMTTGGNQTFSNPDPKTYIKLSTAYAASGRSSYELYVERRPEKFGTCCQYTRSEVMLMSPSQQTWANEWDFAGVSTLIDPSTQFGLIRYQIAFDSKESPDNWQTPFWVGIKNGQYIVSGRQVGDDVTIAPVVKGIWVKWVLHRTWDANGFIRLYMDGKLVYSKTGDVRINGNAPITRLQHGIYKWALQNENNQGEGAGNANDLLPIKMYIDDIKLGLKTANLTLAQFMGSDPVVTPPPVPVPTPVPNPTPQPTPSNNRAPNVYAGNDVTMTSYAAISLNAATASDPDGDALTYKWEIFRGPGTLTSANILKAVFTPNSTGGSTGLRLTVTDSKGANATDTVNVTYKYTPAPIPTPPAPDITNYYVSSAEGTKTIIVNGITKTVKTIVITWKDGTVTELYKK